MTISVKTPTTDQLLAIAGSFGLHLTAADAASFQKIMAGPLASYARLDELVEPTLPVKYPRTPGWRPAPAENPHNAWTWKTDIRGAARGVLARLLVRRLRPEADLGAGAADRRHADRLRHRPLRADGRQHRRRGAAADRDRRARSPRSAHCAGPHRRLSGGARRGGEGPHHRRAEGGLRPPRQRPRDRPQGALGDQPLQGAGRDGEGRVG